MRQIQALSISASGQVEQITQAFDIEAVFEDFGEPVAVLTAPLPEPELEARLDRLDLATAGYGRIGPVSGCGTLVAAFVAPD